MNAVEIDAATRAAIKRLLADGAARSLQVAQELVDMGYTPDVLRVKA